MTNKKICIVSPSLKMGGIERALSVLANYFCSQGYQVSFISAQGGEQFYALDEGVTFYEPDLVRKPGFIGKIKVYTSIVFFIRKTVKSISPNVILSFGDAFNPLVLLAVRNLKIPIFISDRTSPDFGFNTFIRLGKKWLYPCSAGFVAQTERAAAYKRKQFENRLNIMVIPNAVKEIRQLELPKKKTIVSVGRLSFEKGHDRLLQALAHVEGHSDWHLQLAGTGPMKKELENMAIALGINHRVTFLGNVKNIDALLSEASIFVLPSRLEGFPNALCEAMSAGLPCICFDSIPTEAILEHRENGIVIEEGNIEKMAEAMVYLIENESERRRLGANAVKIKDRLNVENIGNQFLSFMFQ